MNSSSWRHIHMTTKDAEAYGVENGDQVEVALLREWAVEGIRKRHDGRAGDAGLTQLLQNCHRSRRLSHIGISAGDEQQACTGNLAGIVFVGTPRGASSSSTDCDDHW